MRCKCGSEMSMVGHGIWVCNKYDFFAVTLLAPKGSGNTQWYEKTESLEYWDSFDELVLKDLTPLGKILLKNVWEAERRGL